MPPYSYAQPQRKLVSQQDQATIENANVPRSKFINQWSRITAFDAGKIIPILVDEILPGDHMTYELTAYLRLSTPLFPLFNTQRVDTHFFFVPNRLVWDNWVKFMGEQDAPGDSIAYLIPQHQYTNAKGTGTIHDYFGLPVGSQIDPAATMSVNALPLRAYNLIFNTWFRDENLKTPAPVPKGSDGPDGDLYFLQIRAKSHDYFTSALPWPQKFTAPTVPLGGLAPVIGIGMSATGRTVAGAGWYETTGGPHAYAWASQDGAALLPPGVGNQNVAFQQDPATGYPQIYADLAATSGVAINTLRQAWLVQQLLERDARGGTRYVELIRSHFGVINPDFRLQRPEYIGGGQSPLNITPIAQTAPTTGVPLGALGAAGTAAGTHRASYAATEHGYVIGLISVKSEISYQQGLHKLWSRSTRYDFYWPSLAGLGEQAILTKEIFCNGLPGNDNTVFGYQERWQEYRTRYSDITGIMRSNIAGPGTGTLDAWHLAQAFSPAPVLNANFIVDNPPMSRVLAAAALANGQQYIADILYHRTAVRPIPTYGTPVTLGRF